MWKDSHSLASMEYKLKTTMGCQVWQDESIDDKSDKPKYWGRFGKVTPLYIVGENEDGTTGLENSLAGFCCCCFKINTLNLQSSCRILKYLTKKTENLSI